MHDKNESHQVDDDWQIPFLPEPVELIKDLWEIASGPGDSQKGLWDWMPDDLAPGGFCGKPNATPAPAPTSTPEPVMSLPPASYSSDRGRW